MIVNTNSDTKLGRTVAPAQTEVPADYLLKWAITREYTEAGDETKHKCSKGREQGFTWLPQYLGTGGLALKTLGSGTCRLAVGQHTFQTLGMKPIINRVKWGNRASPGYHNTWEPGVWQ